MTYTIDNPSISIKSPKIEIAKRLISKYFSIGSIGYDEALDCALFTSEFINDNELTDIITKIKNWEVRNGNLYPDKPYQEILEKVNNKITQMQLF